MQRVKNVNQKPQVVLVRKQAIVLIIRHFNFNDYGFKIFTVRVQANSHQMVLIHPPLLNHLSSTGVSANK
jgi:hypothetical protein